jgi:hypothetical protein
MRRAPLRRRSERQVKLDKLHDLWREVLLARDGAQCSASGRGGIRCGGGLQAHHIYSKGAWPALRYDLENGVLCCRNHHLYWVEVAPAPETGPWLERLLGSDLLERLAMRARASKAGKTRLDLKAVRLWLEQQLKLG